MSSPVADFPIGSQWGTSKINNLCSLQAIIPKILWVTHWVSPCQVSKQEVNIILRTKIWEGSEFAEIAMHCRAWDE